MTRCKDCGCIRKKKDETDSWTYLVLEGYCGRRASVALEKDKYHYQFVEKKEGGWDMDKNGFFKTKRVLNSHYVPGTKTPRKPSWCPQHVCFKCWEEDCKFLGLTRAGKDEMKWMNSNYFQKNSKEKNSNSLK